GCVDFRPVVSFRIKDEIRDGVKEMIEELKKKLHSCNSNRRFERVCRRSGKGARGKGSQRPDSGAKG
ncbi:MAG: hypothetical protein ACP5LF_06685, partial [Nitrososphaeria archaeon]